MSIKINKYTEEMIAKETDNELLKPQSSASESSNSDLPLALDLGTYQEN